MKKKRLLTLLVLLLTAATGAMAQDYYAPSTDEVIILNDVYDDSKSGYSSHSAIVWGASVMPANKTAGDPNNGGQATSTTVKCYSVKGNGAGKNITLSITGVSKVIVYHERKNKYIELRDGSKDGNIIGSGVTASYYTEVALTATNKYSIFLHGTSDGSDDQDFYVYAIKLIAAPAAPTGYSITLDEGTGNKDSQNWEITPKSSELSGGEAVTVKYNGSREVKSVTVVKKAAAAGNPGLLSGVFSVSASKKVNFSKGNLRYASSKWSFFDNQYDYYTDYSEDAWDHFGWSTSTTTYGMNTSDQNSTYSGDFVDWGATMGTGWFTLSKDEWDYLLNTRSASTVGGTENGRCAKAKVNDVQGVILFPDTYTHPDGVTAPVGVNATDETGWNGNTYSSEDWTKMESAGCVFLPAAGYRNGSTMNGQDTYGYYWSATPNTTGTAYRVYSNSSYLIPDNSANRRHGLSVRLVQAVDAPAPLDNTYLEWSGRQKKLVATEIPGDATKVENANAGVTWESGTYVVEGEVNINGTIELSGSVNLIIKDGAKLTVNGYINGNSNKLYIYGQAQMTGELVVNCSNNHAINGLTTLEVHSAEVTATGSGNGKYGGINSDKFNVYGGLVDAKSTAADGGYGISLSGYGSMDIYGGEVKAEGKGTGGWDCGIVCGSFDGATVTVYGGKLWAGNAEKKALNYIYLKKGDDFTGKIETSDNNVSWNEYDEILGTLDHKYVRVGY